MNIAATAIFSLAVLHTFLAARATEAAHRLQQRRDSLAAAPGASRLPSRQVIRLLHVLGEVELVFALWTVPLLIAIAASRGALDAVGYLTRVNYTEPLLVIVIMAMTSTRPIVELAEAAVRRIVNVGRGSPAAWWATILIVGPLLGSLITEPGAMTICALLLARQFYDLRPTTLLKYATLGLLFVNVSIGGTLTHFAAPPVLMVARPWGWDAAYMLEHFGWRAAVAIVVSTLVYYLIFRREFGVLASRPEAIDPPPADTSPGVAPRPIPTWITTIYLFFVVWTVANAHYPVRFLAGFLLFLLFARATGARISWAYLRAPVFVGIFLAGLVIHGRLQEWWIAPALSGLGERGLFAGAAFLTAFNDNALITYLATLVPDLSEELRRAVVEGAVIGGGLTVIANAPNPAGQALLGRFFDDAVHPLYLAAGAAIPTLVAIAAFRLF